MSDRFLINPDGDFSNSQTAAASPVAKPASQSESENLQRLVELQKKREDHLGNCRIWQYAALIVAALLWSFFGALPAWVSVHLRLSVAAVVVWSFSQLIKLRMKLSEEEIERLQMEPIYLRSFFCWRWYRGPFLALIASSCTELWSMLIVLAAVLGMTTAYVAENRFVAILGVSFCLCQLLTIWRHRSVTMSLERGKKEIEKVEQLSTLRLHLGESSNFWKACNHRSTS